MGTHPVIIGCAPDIHFASRFAQNVVVSVNTGQGVTTAIRIILFISHFTHQHVRRFQPVIRHLHGQNAVIIQQGDQAGKQIIVIGDPL